MELRPTQTKITNDGNTLVGYAALYDSPSHMLSERGRRFVEVFAPGAFKRTLTQRPVQLPDITAHYTHDENLRPPMGRTGSGTLKLDEDRKGLRFALDMPGWASDIKESVVRGDVYGMSVKMSDEKDTWEVRDGISYRTVHDCTLWHVALVLRPAYPDTMAGVRSLVEPPEPPVDDCINRLVLQLGLLRRKL